MLITVGHKESYDRMFETNPPEDCVKLGRKHPGWVDSRGAVFTNGYDGGIVFLDFPTAVEYLKERDLYSTYFVYVLDCDLDNTYEYNGVRSLINNTRIFPITELSEEMLEHFRGE